MKRNRGAAGIDRETLADVEQAGVEAFLEDLGARLRATRIDPWGCGVGTLAQHRIAELLHGRRLGVIPAEVRIVGSVAVGVPILFDDASVNIHYGHLSTTATVKATTATRRLK